MEARTRNTVIKYVRLLCVDLPSPLTEISPLLKQSYAANTVLKQQKILHFTLAIDKQ